MSRSYRKSMYLKVEPKTKFDRRTSAKAERRSIKPQLAQGVEDPFYFKATWHSETVVNASFFDDEETWTRK
jgi:hypothetical protein